MTPVDSRIGASVPFPTTPSVLSRTSDVIGFRSRVMNAMVVSSWPGSPGAPGKLLEGPVLGGLQPVQSWAMRLLPLPLPHPSPLPLLGSLSLGERHCPLPWREPAHAQHSDIQEAWGVGESWREHRTAQPRNCGQTSQSKTRHLPGNDGRSKATGNRSAKTQRPNPGYEATRPLSNTSCAPDQLNVQRHNLAPNTPGPI